MESLPCVTDLSAMHYKFQPRFQPQNFCKTTKETIELLFSDTNTAVQTIWTQEQSPAHSANFPIWLAVSKFLVWFKVPLCRLQSDPLLNQPGCIPCKTCAKGTTRPKLSYARHFRGEGAAKNLSTDDFKKLLVLAQILSFLMKEIYVL